MRGAYPIALVLLSLTPADLALTGAASAAERKAAVSRVDPPALSLSPTQQVQMQFGGGALPGELLVPAAQYSGTYLAVSATAWRTSPMEQAFSSEGFVIWTKPPAAPQAAVRAPVPSRVRSPVPLPPPRPVLLATAVQQAIALQSTEAEPAVVVDKVSVTQAPEAIEALIIYHAQRLDLPVRLVRRMVWKESKFNPAARHGPYWGLMQIRVDTARGLGFRGKPADLLDADTNLTYAVAYLANAYRVAGKNERRAEALYTSGYYFEAKRKGLLGALIKTASADE